MSTEQTNQCLKLLKESFENYRTKCKRVAAGHQAAHEALQTVHHEVNLLRGQIETGSRTRLVEPKSLVPDGFGKKTGPSY